MANALLVIADGSEEMEAVITYDLLVRAGIDVHIASVTDTTVTASRGLILTAQSHIKEVENTTFDVIICPGGIEGAMHLQQSLILKTMLENQLKHNRYIAAICAAPALLLEHHGLLQNRRATGYPTTQDKILNYVDEKVVVDAQIITSQGPGTTMAFALKIIELTVAETRAKEVAAQALITV